MLSAGTQTTPTALRSGYPRSKLLSDTEWFRRKAQRFFGSPSTRVRLKFLVGAFDPRGSIFAGLASEDNTILQGLLILKFIGHGRWLIGHGC